MSNRVIKDLIWASPRLADCSISAQLHFPRLLLLSDDWGCFNADCDIVKGLAYPKMKITKGKIKTILNELNDKGLLFIWQTGHHIWGHWIKWEEHEWVSSTETNNRGERIKHRRKTPEPPSKLLEEYIKIHYLEQSGTTRDKLEQTTSYLNPNPNLNHNISIHTLKLWNSKKIIVHKITEELLEAIEKIIKKKKLKEDNIVQGIEHYSIVLTDEKYFFKYIWSLENFLDRKKVLPSFLEGGENWENYKQKNKDNIAIQEADRLEKDWDKLKEKRDDYKHKPIPKKTYEILKDVIPKYRDKLKEEK